MNKFGNERTDPRVCWYRLGHKIRRTIDKALDQNVNNDKELLQSIEGLKKAIDTEEDNKQLLSYEKLSSIHKFLQQIDSKYDLFFYQLLDECRVILPQTRKNKELENRLVDLSCRQSNREYHSMTSGMSRNTPSMSPSKEVSFGSEFSQIRPTLIAVINAFATIGGTFLFCYKAVEYSLPEPHISTQVLSGLFGALIVAIAEMYFLVRII